MMATESPRERELRGRDNGRLELPMSSQRTLRFRFLDKIERREDGCWMWTGARGGRASHQYGKIWAGRRSAAGHPVPDQASRVAYELFVGRLRDDLEIDHLCRNTLCVNPAHLEAVTRKENQRRGRSPMAQQARQTTCKRGHVLDDANTYVWHGMRRCRVCQAADTRRYREKKRC